MSIPKAVTKVVFTENCIPFAKEHDVVGVVLDPADIPAFVRLATAADVAPELWGAYSNTLNDTALTALEQVILGTWTKELRFVDSKNLDAAFVWEETEHGYYFWDSVNKGGYNKQEEPEVDKFDFTNTKIDTLKYANEYGITHQQAIRDIESLFGFTLELDDTENLPQFLYSFGGKTWSHNSKALFENSDDKEITIKRNTTLTACFVPEETITLPGGKVVLKKDYDEAIANLNPFP